VVSSALLVGNLSARVPLVFDQANRTMWSDDLIGSGVTASLNLISHPIIVTNEGAVTERWAIVFTNTTTFRLIGEHVGVIAEGNVANDFSPSTPSPASPISPSRLRHGAAAGARGTWCGSTPLARSTPSAAPAPCSRATPRSTMTLSPWSSWATAITRNQEPLQ
jgi:hypothetical protein